MTRAPPAFCLRELHCPRLRPLCEIHRAEEVSVREISRPLSIGQRRSQEGGNVALTSIMAHTRPILIQKCVMQVGHDGGRRVEGFVFIKDNYYYVVWYNYDCDAFY